MKAYLIESLTDLSPKALDSLLWKFLDGNVCDYASPLKVITLIFLDIYIYWLPSTAITEHVSRTAAFQRTPGINLAHLT